MIRLPRRSYKKCNGREMEKMPGRFALGSVRLSDGGVAEFVSETEPTSGFFALRHFQEDRFPRDSVIGHGLWDPALERVKELPHPLIPAYAGI